MMVSPCCLSEMEEMGDCPACGVVCGPLHVRFISPERMVRALLEALPGSGDPLLEHMHVKRMERAAMAWLRDRESRVTVELTVHVEDAEDTLNLEHGAAAAFLQENHKWIVDAMWGGARDAMEELKP